jgi:hypothetical protein
MWDPKGREEGGEKEEKERKKKEKRKKKERKREEIPKVFFLSCRQLSAAQLPQRLLLNCCGGFCSLKPQWLCPPAV